jgi:hypothetical protein
MPSAVNTQTGNILSGNVLPAQYPDGVTPRGTFTATGTTAVTVADAAFTANTPVVFTLKTVGGTVGAYPSIKTVTPGTGFTVACTASDTSVYNYWFSIA